MQRAIIIDKRDNVATAIDDLSPGETISLDPGGRPVEIAITEPIPFGHKIALVAIIKGGDVIKYDETVGTATAAIGAGEHVHVHNVVSNRANARQMKPGQDRT